MGFINRENAHSYKFLVTQTAQYIDDNTYTVSSGDVVNIGQLCGVALGDQDADGNFVLDFGVVTTIFNLTAKGADANGNSAIAAGDKLYVELLELNKDATNGKYFGIALGAVSSGQTGEIAVVKL